MKKKDFDTLTITSEDWKQRKEEMKVCTSVNYQDSLKLTESQVPSTDKESFYKPSKQARKPRSE